MLYGGLPPIMNLSGPEEKIPAESLLAMIDRKPLKDHMEAVGHKEAFDFVGDLVKDQVPLSESIIKQIHYLVLTDKRDDRGVYRRVPVRIMGAKHEP